MTTLELKIHMKVKSPMERAEICGKLNYTGVESTCPSRKVYAHTRRIKIPVCDKM